MRLRRRARDKGKKAPEAGPRLKDLMRCVPTVGALVSHTCYFFGQPRVQPFSFDELEDLDGSEPKDDASSAYTSQTSLTTAATRPDGAPRQSRVSRRARMLRYMCPKTHRDYLRDKVYSAKCLEHDCRRNTGVLDLVTKSDPCFCRLNTISFKNFYLGDRGVVALLSLLGENHYLKSLNLAGNGLHYDGCVALTTTLKDPDAYTDLRAVDVSCNPLCAKSFHCLKALVVAKRNLVLLGTAETSLPMHMRNILIACVLKNARSCPREDLDEAFSLADGGTSREFDYFHDRHAWGMVKAYAATRTDPPEEVEEEEEKDVSRGLRSLAPSRLQALDEDQEVVLET